MDGNAVREMAGKVRLMGFDVDGVMTDGTIWFGPDGDLYVGDRSGSILRVSGEGSRVRVFEGDPCALPADFGPFDMGVLASVLLHTRRPFDLLQSVADRVRHTMVITEMHDPTLGDEPLAKLLPHRGVDQIDTWWQFTPQFFTSALGLLGFTHCRVTYHRQLQPAYDRDVPFFTVVAERPAPAAGGSLA